MDKAAAAKIYGLASSMLAAAALADDFNTELCHLHSYLVSTSGISIDPYKDVRHFRMPPIVRELTNLLYNRDETTLLYLIDLVGRGGVEACCLKPLPKIKAMYADLVDATYRTPSSHVYIGYALSRFGGEGLELEKNDVTNVLRNVSDQAVAYLRSPTEGTTKAIASAIARHGDWHCNEDTTR